MWKLLLLLCIVTISMSVPLMSIEERWEPEPYPKEVGETDLNRVITWNVEVRLQVKKQENLTQWMSKSAKELENKSKDDCEGIQTTIKKHQAYIDKVHEKYGRTSFKDELDYFVKVTAVEVHVAELCGQPKIEINKEDRRKLGKLEKFYKTCN